MKYISQSKWIEIKKDKLPCACALCGKNKAVELAHMPLHKRNFNSKKVHKYLDNERNAVPICIECKEVLSECYEGRLIAVKWLRSKYPDWDEWYDSLPFKIKEVY